MNIRIGTTFVTMLVLLATVGVGSALAHRFNVALVIPTSGAGAEEGRQYRDGFMLATTERDGHPNEESDGHLGGLDVYVSIIDAQGDVEAEIERIVSEGEINIVAAFGSDKALAMANDGLDGKNIALLRPGQSPFAQTGTPAVGAFSAAFEGRYGRKPSAPAAQGYNAARRIDVAVRAQGGAADTGALLQVFRDTATGFSW